MGVLSGILGAVDGKKSVRSWTITTTNEIAAFVTSGGKHGTGRIAGNGDWNGSYEALGHTPEVMPGEALVFTGTIDGTNGATGTAIVDSVTINWDQEGGAPITHTVNFSSNGALTLGAAAATDVVVPTPVPSVACKVMLDLVGGTPAELVDVRNMSLTITAGNAAYKSSSSAGGTLRTAGNIDFTLSISVYTDDFANLPAAGDVKEVHLYVDDTLFWSLKWVIFGDASDLKVDVEEAAIVSATLNGAMNGTALLVATQTLGEIAQPGPTVWWPTP